MEESFGCSLSWKEGILQVREEGHFELSCHCPGSAVRGGHRHYQTTSRKYVCSNFSNNHNHDIDEEDSLVKAAHRSLNAEVLSQPFDLRHLEETFALP